MLYTSTKLFTGEQQCLDIGVGQTENGLGLEARFSKVPLICRPGNFVVACCS